MPPTYSTVLHKSEWERLKKQSQGHDENLAEGPLSEKYEYLKALTEQSQERVKHWPDTVAGHVAVLEKAKRRQEKKNMAFIKEFAKTHIQEHTDEAIKNAKQMIFDHSSYGKQLIGALIESRTLKERDAQIEFKNKLKLEAAELAKKDEANDASLFNFEASEIERKNIQKSKTLECIRYNQEMIAKKKEKQLKIIEKEKQCAIEGDKLMEQIIANEEKAKEELKRLEKQGLKEYEAERKELAKIKVHNEKLDNDLIKTHKKALENKREKIEQVLEKVHLGKLETKRSKDLYSMIEHIQHENNKRFEDFLESSVNLWDKRNATMESKGKEQEKQKRLFERAISEENKLRGEEDRCKDVSCLNKCVCDRQTISTKTYRKPLKVRLAYEDISDKKKRPVTPVKKQSFLEPRKSLLQQLRQREKEPSPWNGTRGAHAQFAVNAAGILKECEHKHLVHKVIDEYRRLNCLDYKTLPLP